MLSFARRAELEQAYRGMQPLIQYIGKTVGPNCTFLDVGSGEGYIALLMATDLQAGRTILVDNRDEPLVDLPPDAEFHLLDVHSEQFVERFQNKANVVVCLAAFHEFNSPIIATINLIRIMPTRGVLLILDCSEKGWDYRQSTIAQQDLGRLLHFGEDMRRIKASGLRTNAGINRFWLEEVSPRVPGECILQFMGNVYSMLYIPRQWGEVKKPPLNIQRALDSLH